MPIVSDGKDYVPKCEAEIGFFIREIGQTFAELDSQAL